MNKVTVLILLITSITNCYGRNALKYFLEKRKVQNCTFIILTNTTSDTIWVEYTYFFQNKTNDDGTIKKDFAVGLFANFDFDCKLNNGLSGYTIEIFKLLKCLEFRFTFKKFNYSNITTALLSKEIDIIACHPNIETGLPTGVVQVYPTLKNDYVLVYDPYKLHFTKDIFILTFAGTLWICFFILLVILAISLHLSSKQYSFLDLKYEPWTWVDITLWANAAACQQGLSHTPNGFASRLIFLLGYLISYLLYTGFAAGITSLLLQQVMSKELTVADIEKMNIKIVTIKDFQYFPSILHNNSVVVSSMDNVFTYINRDDVVGVVPKLLVEQYFATKSQYYFKYATSKQAFSHYSKSFLMNRRNSSNRVIANKLMRLREIGLLSKALKDSLLPSPSDESMSKYSSAGIEHVGSAITILVVGTVCSTIFLVLELVFALYNGKL